jgi:hypothetical protein
MPVPKLELGNEGIDVEQSAPSPDEKLKLLQRLDRYRPWKSTHQRRLCLGCGKIISGTEIRLSRSMWGIGLLRLRCPTENCSSGPMDWVEPDSGK